MARNNELERINETTPTIELDEGKNEHKFQVYPCVQRHKKDGRENVEGRWFRQYVVAILPKNFDFRLVYFKISLKSVVITLYQY